MTRMSVVFVVVVCALLLALAASPVLAQLFEFGSIALGAGDTLTVNCSTQLVALSQDDKSQTLHCALISLF